MVTRHSQVLRARHLAHELGVSEQLVKQARMDPSARGYRNPPPGWEKTIARLLRERGRAMLERAEELEV